VMILLFLNTQNEVIFPTIDLQMEISY